MNIEKTKIPGLVLIKPDFFADNRGYFYESWQSDKYKNINSNTNFVQDNISYSKKNTLRGIHYQIKNPQGQLVFVTAGKIFDLSIDLRKDSETFKQCFCIELDAVEPMQIYMPPGIGHGFCVLSEYAIVNYKCTEYYSANNEAGVYWNSLDMPWPVKNPIVSDRDNNFPNIENI